MSDPWGVYWFHPLRSGVDEPGLLTLFHNGLKALKFHHRFFIDNYPKSICDGEDTMIHEYENRKTSRRRKKRNIKINVQATLLNLRKNAIKNLTIETKALERKIKMLEDKYHRNPSMKNQVKLSKTKKVYCERKNSLKHQIALYRDRRKMRRRL